MEASDAQIPIIYKNIISQGSSALKKAFLNFLKQYTKEPNDYGGKIVKILELLNEKKKSSNPLMKSLVNKNLRPLLLKINSFWVTEHLIKVMTPQLIFSASKEKPSIAPYRFVASIDLKKVWTKP